MPSFGSIASPAWGAWQWSGIAGRTFAGKYTSPAFDIYITHLHAYFDTYKGNGALGYLTVWSGDDASGALLLAVSSGFVINNGVQTWGGQEWWDHPISPLFVPASTPVWLGGHSDQGIVWSTYDTSPNTYYGTTGLTVGSSGFGTSVRSNTGQGPPGAYADYSKVVYGTTFDMGANGGGLKASTAKTIKPGSAANLGMRSSGGIAPINALVRSGGTATMGSNGSGMAPIVAITKIPKIWVWRP